MTKVNGEIIAGAALVGLAVLFIYAGIVNSVWATLLPADIIILGIGVAVIILGIRSLKNTEAPDRVHEHQHS